MIKHSRLAIGVISLIVFSLACTLGNSSSGSNVTPQSIPQPVATDLSATRPPVAPTFSPAGSSLSTSGPTNSTSLPPPTATATSKPPTATATKIPVTAGPLSFRYEVVKIARLPNNQAALTLHVIATGGSGGYKYYHDDVLQPGDTFDVPGTCGAKFTHTLRVSSADGQTISQQYQESGKCPTPTPTPP